ncbi:hypothetical protein PMJ10TS2_65170 [Paenibacillus melissococcoides]|nr:hypothetical protein [Paenibacillus phage Pd_22F]
MYVENAKNAGIIGRDLIIIWTILNYVPNKTLRAAVYHRGPSFGGKESPIVSPIKW